MTETFHIEALGFSDGHQMSPVLQRQSVRSDSLDRVRQRAVRLLQRSQTPLWTSGKVEAIRVLDGSGAEIFRWSLWDELSGVRPG